MTKEQGKGGIRLDRRVNCDVCMNGLIFLKVLDGWLFAFPLYNVACGHYGRFMRSVMRDTEGKRRGGDECLKAWRRRCLSPRSKVHHSQVTRSDGPSKTSSGGSNFPSLRSQTVGSPGRSEKGRFWSHGLGKMDQ